MATATNVTAQFEKPNRKQNINPVTILSTVEGLNGMPMEGSENA